MRRRLAWTATVILVLCIAWLGGFIAGQAAPRIRWYNDREATLVESAYPPAKYRLPSDGLGLAFTTFGVPPRESARPFHPSGAGEGQTFELGLREDGVVVWRTIGR